MTLSKLNLATMVRLLVALALSLSLSVPPGFCQDTEDSQLFIAGFNAYQSGNYNVTIARLDEVLKKYPETSLRDMALFWLARAHYKSGHPQEAARFMSQFTREYPDSPLKATVEEGLLALAAGYDRGEQVPASGPAGKETLAAIAQAEKARLKAEQERIAAQKAEQQRIAAEKARQDRLATERAEKAKAEEVARQAAREAEQRQRQAEQERLARLKAEQERIAAQKAEQQRIDVEKARQERIAAEQARKAKAEEAALRAARQAEQRRLAAAQVEQKRLERIKAEQERAAIHEAERQRIAAEKALAEKNRLREKAIEQYKTVIRNYPNTKAAAVAAAKLRGLGAELPDRPRTASAAIPEIQGGTEQVLTLEVAQFAAFTLTTATAPATSEVANPQALPFQITNQGNGTDSFELESGFPAEYASSFTSAAAPEQAITRTPSLAPGETFKGLLRLTIPAASIDGLRVVHPIKAVSRFMGEVTQSREIQLVAAAPLPRAIVKTEKTEPLPGETLSYRVVLLNVGSTAARNASLRFDFPPQLEPLDTAAASPGKGGRSTLVFENIQLKSGESREMKIALRLKEDTLAGQELLCHAELINNQLKTSAMFVSNAARVKPVHSIQVRALSQRIVVIPGQTVNASFIVTNNGNLRETFKISPEIRGAGKATVFHDLNRDGIRQSNEPAITEIGPLEPKEQAGIVVEINTDRATADASEGSARLTLTPGGEASRAVSAVAGLVYARPVLQLAMSSASNRLKPGDVASFNLSITNRGSNLARTVDLQSSWPEQLEFVASEPANSSIVNGKVFWRFKELGAGEKRAIRVSFRVKQGIGAGSSIQVSNVLRYEDQLGNRY